MITVDDTLNVTFHNYPALLLGQMGLDVDYRCGRIGKKICSSCRGIGQDLNERVAVDSIMIDQALDELAKLVSRLDKNPKKSRKDQNTIKKIQEIRDTIQDSVLYAKLKKSIDEK